MAGIEKTDPPRELAPNLWIIDGDWQESSLRRRMTVVRLRDGSLWLHSPIALEGEALAWLHDLGPVTWIVAPNAFHASELSWYCRCFPGCFAVASDGALDQLSKKGRHNLLSASQISEQHWKGEITAVEIRGTRLMHETAFVHHPSRTLILTDLAFHMSEESFSSGFEKWLMARNRVGSGRFGPSWLAEHFFFKNHRTVSRSLQKIAALDFDRIIVNHGAVVEREGKHLFLQSFDRWLLSARS